MSILSQKQPAPQVVREVRNSRGICVAPGISPDRVGEVQPAFFHLVAITGFRPIQGGGMWLNCQFEYRKPAGGVYHVEAACRFNHRCQSAGDAYVRSCSCPDGLMRRGQPGAARKCKHMIGLSAHVALTVGQGPAVAVKPELYDGSATDPII